MSGSKVIRFCTRGWGLYDEHVVQISINFRQRGSYEKQVQTIFGMYVDFDVSCATRVTYRIVPGCKYISGSSIQVRYLRFILCRKL